VRRTRRGDRLSCEKIPAGTAGAWITAAHQVAECFGECACGAAVSREPLERPSFGRATPVRNSFAARRRHHLRCAFLVQCWGGLAGA
jgi:hypothetical protein